MIDDVDDCTANGGWQDFKNFLWYQVQLTFWAVGFYVIVQFVYSLTGRLT